MRGQHLRLSSQDLVRVDEGAAKDEKGGRKKKYRSRGETPTRKEIGRYTRASKLSLLMVFGPHEKGGFVHRPLRRMHRTSEVPFSRRTRIDDDAHNIHPWPFWPSRDTCVPYLFLAIRVCVCVYLSSGVKTTCVLNYMNATATELKGARRRGREFIRRGETSLGCLNREIRDAYLVHL